MPSAFRWSFFSRGALPSSESQGANDQISGNEPPVSTGDFEPTILDIDAETEKWPDTAAAEIANFDETVRASLD
jgi:hypothetical protein